jgi:hypothetical protein
MAERMRMWVLYEHPKDMPDMYVARLHVIDDNGSRPTEEFYAHKHLQSLIDQLKTEDPNLVWVDRHPTDDGVILGTFL